MIHNFDFYSPTEVLFGKETQKDTGKYVKKYNGHNILIVYGSDRIVKNRLLEEITSSLKNENINYHLLSGVVPNPQLGKVYEGIDLGKREKIDFLLAIGGGSVIDTAKAIAYGLAEPENNVWELFEHQRKAKACLPVASVLTIAAAGSETSMGAVITNEKNEEKRAYDDDLARPKFAIMNPESTLNLPDFQTECGATDIMMHTMERYFTNGGNMELTDAIAEGLLRTVKENALLLHHDPQNYDARAEVMWAGSLSHNNLTGCGNDGGDFATHMLEHEVSGMFNVTHGAGLAAIWPSWARYVYKDDLARFVKFAKNVMRVQEQGTDEEIALAGIDEMVEFYHSIGMPANFAELGIHPSETQIMEMAQSCSNATGGHKGSAKVLYYDDMVQIYKMANQEI